MALTFFTFRHLVCFSFLIFHLAIAHFISSTQPLCHHHERSALLNFKQSLVINQTASSDPSAYPKVASWKLDEKDRDCCSWDGVKCNEDTGHVVELDLASSCLYGSINSTSSLFQLVHLQRLSLFDNNFNFSEIPSEILNFSRLTHLNLSESYFSGQIPAELLELSNLEVLDLAFCSFDHFFLKLQKPGLANLAENLTNLKALNLINVHISSTVPHILANLSSLRILSLSGCYLQGEFPPGIFQLPNLQFLGVMKNPNLTGYLPQFQKSSPLEDLRLSTTRFSGKIPDSIENLESLSYLDISDCSFIGKIPSSLFNLTKLEYLYLSGNRFLDELPTSIGNFASLKTLEIYSINSSGTIAAFGNLTQLSSLTISGSNLVGEIPSVFMNLTQLTNLDLSQNQLTGHIPVEINNLTQLQYLQFSSNQLEGSVPSSIFELRNLETLDLSFNNLSGTVDLNMFLLSLKRLNTLVLSSNKMSLLTEATVNTYSKNINVIGLRSCNLTEFPHFLYNQKFLDSVDLSSNRIAGQVPGWFLNNVLVHGLDYLNLSHNLLTGFGQDLSVLSWAVTTLDLSFNKLRGPLPIPVPAFTSSYLVSNNQLTGEIPPSICSLNRLYALDLSHNNLSGMLPGCLGNSSVQLLVLKLQGNKFHGFIPETFSKGTNLRMIDFNGNLLQGRVPKSLANCVKLKFLNLGDNQITDFFPSWLGTLPELEVLILKSNNFHGVIEEPKACFEFVKLRIIDLSHNRFAGNLPSKHFECWNAMKDVNANNLTYLQDRLLGTVGYPELTYYGFSYYSLILSNKGTELEYEKLSNLITAIILSNNSFVGEIPTSIANLKGLRTLNLSNNNLQGHIPPTLGNLIVIESLDLSNNKFSGQIPQQLGELTTLEVLDVSDNLLTGPIPQGKQFNTFGKGSFDGNPGLCGQPFSKKCDNSATSPPEEDPRSESLFAFGWKTVLIGYASGTVIGVVLGHIFSTRKYEWLAKTFGLQPKTNGRRRRVGRHRQRIFLVIRGCSFSGKLPPSVGNLTKLNHLYLSGNDFSVEVRKLAQLQFLRLAENQLEGSVPNSIFELRNLQALDLSYNNLSGTVDLNMFLLNLKSLTSLVLSSNKFSLLTGTNVREIPMQICSLNGLHALDLSYYNLSGMLPECLGNFSVELSALKLQANNFYGIIPQTFMNGTNLMMIDFSNNLLQGGVPKSLANCLKLKFLNLGDNQITDVFPSWLGTLPELEVLILKFNNFHGEIEEPKTSFEFPKLRIIDLSHSRITDLSSNKLTGQIPQQLVELTSLTFFDVSHNHLKGAIPQGTQFSTFTNDWFAGNPGLCREPLSRKCGNSEASPAEDDPPSESVLAFDWKIVLAGYASGTIIGVVLGHIFCTRKYEWLIKTFRLPPESNGRRRRHRHRM
ncbi:Receptor-like protein 7 [Citrus sinensis]|nr:Receptor-like protein 7 [Citrus sinensis]